MKSNTVKKVVFVTIITIAVIAALAIPYLVNYLRPLFSFEWMMDEYNISVVGKTEFVSRSAIEKMISYSSTENRNHYNKYSRILFLPLSAYPMSAKQQVELGFFAMSKEDTLNFVKAHKNQTIIADNGKLDFAIS